MDNQAIVDRIRHLMKTMNLRQVEFAQRIGVDTSNLSKYLNGRLLVSESLVNRIVVNLGVSKLWLEEGADVPFPRETPPPVVTMPASAIARPAGTLPAMHTGTPVYDIDVTAGAMPRDMMFADEHIIGWVDLPSLGEGRRIVRVSGDSMVPVISDGDFLALRELANSQYVFWGQIYVVLLDDFRLVKFVRKHSDPQLVVLRSANPAYDDMEVNRSDIREMMLVEKVLHIVSRL